MQDKLLRKGIALTIILLFIGMSVYPTIGIGVNNRFQINNSIIDTNSKTVSNTWATTYCRWNYIYGNSVQQTNDGGYIAVCRISMQHPKEEIWLVKTDSNGNIEWDKIFENQHYSTFSYSVLQTTDGGFIIGGSLNDDIWLIKTDINGNTEWDKTFDTGYSREVIQTLDGGYVIVGVRDSDIFLIKTDNNGDMVWDKTFGDEGWDDGSSVKQTADGGYIIAGQSEQDDDIYEDLLLLKTDGDGKLIWEKTFGGKKDDYGTDIQVTDDGGYIIVGGSEVNGYRSDDVWLLRTDGDGELLWDKKFGDKEADAGSSVKQSNDGGYIIAGGTTQQRDYNALLIKTDGDGNEVWKHIYGVRGESESFLDVQQTTDGGYILTGSNQTGCFWLVKTDSSGNAPIPIYKTRNSLNFQFSRFLEQFPILKEVILRLINHLG